MGPGQYISDRGGEVLGLEDRVGPDDAEAAVSRQGPHWGQIEGSPFPVGWQGPCTVGC